MAQKVDVSKIITVEKTPQENAHRQAIEERVRNAAVRAVHAEFANALPTEARQSGAFTVPATHANGNQPAVPNGRYRVRGTDWLHRFKTGRWVGAERVAPQAEPDWVEVPDSVSGDPEVPAAANG